MHKGEETMALDIVWILVGFVLLIKGADFLVNGSVKIAKRFHVSEIIIGLTIVSIGTSMPEMIVSVTSGMGGHNDMAIGNVIGSNLCNLLLILGITALVRPIVFQKETKCIEIPIALVATILLLILCNNAGNVIGRYEGAILLICFVAFIAYTIYMGIREARKENTQAEMDSKEMIEPEKYGMLKAILLIVVGIVGLKIGGDLVVNNATDIARLLHISEKIISLTIIAIGTSLPELVTSIVAAIRKENDIAIGNIIGSNIFNILFILGVSSVVTPINYSDAYNMDFAILIASTILLAAFPFIGKKDTMTRTNGAIFLIAYIAYMVSMFVR